MSARRQSSGTGTLIVRLLVIGVFLAVVLLFVQDRQVNARAMAAYAKVDSLLKSVTENEGKGNFKKRPSQAEVQKEIGRSPDGAPVAKGGLEVETYTFKGMVKQYRIYVGYMKSKEGMEMDKVAFEKPIE